MITSNLSVNRACPVYTFKTKRNHQPSFKGNVVEKPAKQDQQEGMTKEQKTWLGVGLATITTVAIGLIAWACAKNKSKSKFKKQDIILKKIEYTKPELPLVKMIENGGTNRIKFSKNVNDINQALKMKQPILNKDNPNWELVKKLPIVNAPFESQNDFQINEIMTIIPYYVGIMYNKILEKAGDDFYYQDNNLEFLTYKNCCKPQDEMQLLKIFENSVKLGNEARKNFLIKYLKERSKYFDKDNEFDVVRSKVLKNPSDDVVDVETLRLYTLANNTRQFLYSDNSVEEPHRMVNFVRPLLNANFSAKMLEEFKPKKENLSENEKKYFEYMNKLGKFWHERLKKEASEKLPKFTKIITGKVEAPKCYKTLLEERYDKRNIFLLDIPIYKSEFPLADDGKYPIVMMDKFTDILSDETKAKLDEFVNINKKEEISTLSGMITYLEQSFILLKNRVDYCTYNWYKMLEKEVNQLIPQVLIRC